MKIYENSMKFNENTWKCKENTTKKQCGGFAEIQWNCKGGTLIEINENQWKFNEIQSKYIKYKENVTKMQCGGFAEIQSHCKGVPLQKSMKIYENSTKFNENI